MTVSSCTVQPNFHHGLLFNVLIMMRFQGHLREAKCHLAMGEAAAAVCSYERVLQLDPSNTTATNEVRSGWQCSGKGECAQVCQHRATERME